MLKLYLTEVPHQNLNDAYFDGYMDKIKFSDKNVQNIMYAIDGVKYAGNNRIYSKFETDLAVSVTELSTGCKTAINIYTFKNEIFTLAECGDNALQVIFNFKHGNTYLPYFCLPYVFNNEIEVYYNKNKWIINNNIQLEKILSKTFQ